MEVPEGAEPFRRVRDGPRADDGRIAWAAGATEGWPVGGVLSMPTAPFLFRKPLFLQARLPPRLDMCPKTGLNDQVG